jgi:hypothetical protein
MGGPSGANGISSNKVKGEWTGVSMARYERLLRLARDASDGPLGALGGPLIDMYAWRAMRRAEDMAAFRHGGGDEETVLGMMPATTTTTATGGGSAFLFLDALANAALQLQRRDWARWPIDVVKHLPYEGAATEVPDCVEVAVREILEYVTSDGLAADLEPSRELQRLLAFSDVAASSAAAAKAASQEWFRALQRVRGKNVKFLQKRPDNGEPFELAPTAATVSSVCAQLLRRHQPSVSSGENTGLHQQLHDDDDNDVNFAVLRRLGFDVTVVEERFALACRPFEAPDFKHRYTITLASPASRDHQLAVELELEKAHPSAKVAYTGLHVQTKSAAWLRAQAPPALLADARQPAWLLDAAFAAAPLQPLEAARTAATGQRQQTPSSSDDLVRLVLGTNWRPRVLDLPAQRAFRQRSVECLALVAARDELRWLARFILPRLDPQCDPAAVHRAVRGVPELRDELSALGFLTPDTVSAASFIRKPGASLRLAFGI